MKNNRHIAEYEIYEEKFTKTAPDALALAHTRTITYIFIQH